MIRYDSCHCLLNIDQLLSYSQNEVRSMHMKGRSVHLELLKNKVNIS